MTHTINQQRFRCFILFLLFLGGNVFNSQLIHAQTLDDGVLRIFAYDLHSTYTPIEGTELGTYTFYFKSNVPADSGKLYFYHGKIIDYIHEIKNGETVTRRDTIWQDKQVGEFLLPDSVITKRDPNTGVYTFSLSKDQIPVDVTNKDAYLDMTWAIELQAEKITGKYPETAKLVYPDGEAFYTFYSYSNANGEIYKQVREPHLLMVDNNFRCPQGIAIDNNPQSPFFGRVYVANAPTDDDSTDYVPANPYDAGIIVYEPDPVNGLYKKLVGSYMPSGVTFPSESEIDDNTRFYMHRIAVNPTNGNVYYSKSTDSVQSAIYQLIPDSISVLTDNGTAINVTENLIPADGFASSELHPINSLAFGPGGELYVMSHANGKKEITAQTFAGATIPDSVGTGVIYKLTKDDGDDRYDAYAQYYTPNTTPREVFDWKGTKIHEAEGLPFSVNPWVNADNAMVVTARGSFWVTQYRPEIDKYVFLAHIHPQGYIQGKQYGSSLSPYFQYSLGDEVIAETFSGNVVTPMWYARHMLSPHQHTSIIEANTYPSGHVAIYEKGGMKSTEAMLAVAFREKVCVFKLVYNDKNYEWFGFNLDWMFEIPIEHATFIDGLAFDYAGNLFVASESTHSLYVYSLPNYGMMKPDNNPPLQPTNFDDVGYRQDIVYGDNFPSDPNDYTDTSNNLNRGKPLDDNNVTTRAHLDLKVDGAIVYDERYFETPADGEENLTEFDAQWSTKRNWNIKRVPDSTDIPVVIRSNAVLDEKQSVSGMTIENNSQLTIARNGGLTIGEGGIKGASKKGVLTLENFSAIDGSDPGAGYLRIHPSVTDMPKVTVHYHTKAQPSDTDPEENAHRLWQYVGAPGKGTIATSTSTTSLYQWKESEGGWVKKTDTTPMKPFVEGYAITQDGAPDYWWTTTAINDTQSIPLSYTEDSRRNEGDTTELISGQNIIANSYLAPINVAAFIDSDFSDNIVKTFYLFNTGSWTEWNDAKETPYVQDQSSGHYTAIPTSAAQNFDPSSDPTFIPPMSGIFVRTGSGGGTITFNYERLVWSWADSNGAANDPMYAPSRVAGQSQQTYAPELLRRIRIQAYGEGSGSDRMYIMQDTRCTSGYDNGWDGENMHAAGQVNIYTNEPCGKMEVSCSNSIDSMYIGFCAGADTIYTLRFTSLIGDSLYIKDLENDSIIALAEEGTYTFHAPAMSVNDMRFQVQLNPEFPAGHSNGNGNSGTTTAIDNVSSPKVWISDNIVYVSTGQEENIVVLCNMHGQVLYQHSFDYQTQLSMAGLPAGVYLMKINNEIYKYVLQ